MFNTKRVTSEGNHSRQSLYDTNHNRAVKQASKQAQNIYTVCNN